MRFQERLQLEIGLHIDQLNTSLQAQNLHSEITIGEVEKFLAGHMPRLTGAKDREDLESTANKIAWLGSQIVAIRFSRKMINLAQQAVLHERGGSSISDPVPVTIGRGLSVGGVAEDQALAALSQINDELADYLDRGI